MRSILGIWIFVALTAAAVAQEQTELQQIRVRLQRRDRELPSVYFPFHIRAEFRRDTNQSYEQVGWWALVGQNAGIEVQVVDNASLPRFVRGLWNGVQYEGSSNFDAGVPTVTIEPTRGSPYATYYPDFYGLWVGPFALSRLLADREGSVRVLSTEAIDGHSCMKLLYDANPGPTPGDVRMPMLIWYEPETALALKAIRYQVATRQSSYRPTTKIGDGLFTPMVTWDVLESKEIAHDVFIPIRGCQSSPDSICVMNMTVDPAGLIVNEDSLIQNMIQFPPNRWYIVRDRISDVAYTRGPLGNGPLELGSFYLEVAEDATQRGLKPAEPKSPDLPTGQFSCGLYALWHVALASGLQVSASTLLECLTPSERDGVELSLDSLSRIASSIGLHALPIRCDAEDLRILTSAKERWVIVHQRRLQKSVSAGSADVDHFALARVRGTDVELLNAPETSVTIPLESFLASWTGYGLLVSKNEADISPFVGRNRGSVVLLITAGALVLVALGVSFRKKARSFGAVI
jgi:hypothetical protein